MSVVDSQTLTLTLTLTLDLFNPKSIDCDTVSRTIIMCKFQVILIRDFCFIVLDPNTNPQKVPHTPTYIITTNSSQYRRRLTT